MDLRESATRVGDRHPWERARFEFVLRRLVAADGLGARTLLDVGSGDAWFASRLLQYLRFDARCTCVDAHYTPDLVRGLALDPRIDARTVLPDGTFDLVLALDVAEHVEDDVSFLASIAARLAPGGLLAFTVPAWPALYSDHDRALGHYRRYTHASARALLEGAGLHVLDDGGCFHGLIAARAAQLAREKLRGGAHPAFGATHVETAFGGGPLLAEVVTSVLLAEQRMTHALRARGLTLPGLSYYALARR